MAPQRTTPKGRPIAISTKVSEDEAAFVDADRGSLTRAMYLRLLITDRRKAQK